VNLDEDALNADWTKQSLDLFLPDGGGQGGLIPVDYIDRLREWIKQGGYSVEEFVEMPLYRNAVQNNPWMRELIERAVDAAE
jgi:hypothetical protein